MFIYVYIMCIDLYTCMYINIYMSRCVHLYIMYEGRKPGRALLVLGHEIIPTVMASQPRGTEGPLMSSGVIVVSQR